MPCAKTLFRLAHLNSEIKYILHSVNKKAPRYTYPQIPDVAVWQDDLWQRLQECNSNAPKFVDDRHYLTVVCSIRYHEIVMHLFRPTPHIRNPTKSSLLKCYDSAEKAIGLWKELYEADRMSYSWVTIHSVCLSALTILYCIWTSEDIAASTRIDAFTSTMCDASVLLSAAGEYWIEARRSRNRLDTLVSATVRWLTDRLNVRATPTVRQQRKRKGTNRSQRLPAQPGAGWDQRNLPALQPAAQSQDSTPVNNFTLLDQDPGDASSEQVHGYQPASAAGFNDYINSQDLASFLGAPDIFASDNNFLMDGMFTDYQPLFEFSNTDMGMAWPF